jgi:DNA-binding CsgD family transcriptional regulator/ketosteroid isomerase-like protein
MYAAVAMSTAILEQWYTAYDARDLDALCGLAHPDVEIMPVSPALTKLSGTTFRGHAGLRTVTNWFYENYPRLQLESTSARVVSGGILAAATWVVDDRPPQPVRSVNHTLYMLAGERVRRASCFATERQALAAGVGAARRGAVLTRREREVLQLLARGLNAPQIAAELFVTPATVRTHVQNAMTRLGASTRIHAVSIALERKEIEP